MDLEMNASRKKWVMYETDVRGEESTIVFDEPPQLSEESCDQWISVRYEDVFLPSVTVYVKECEY